MVEVDVERGVDDFYRLSKALKHAGQTDMRKQLHKAMRDTAKPLVAKAREAAGDDGSGIPRRGGLAARIAKTAFRAKVSTGAAKAGVSIAAPGKAVTARLLNATGNFRHPVYGSKLKSRKEWAWAAQSAPSAIGWFDRAMRNNADLIRQDLLDALDRVRREILDGIH